MSKQLDMDFQVKKCSVGGCGNPRGGIVSAPVRIIGSVTVPA